MWAKPFYDEALAQELLRVLVQEGVNHFDTSPSYGKGLGERRLGYFLKECDPATTVISTKVGTNLLNGDLVRAFDRKSIERSFLESLKRLGQDHVDILYLHGPAVRDLSEEVFEFFAEQKAERRITFSGVNSFDNSVLREVAATPIDAVMLQYNVSDFRNSVELDRLHAAGKIVISGTALARAKFDLSTFVPCNKSSLWYLMRMLRREPGFLWSGYKLRKRLTATGSSPVEAAIQFVTRNPKILSNLFGTSNIEHARFNARAGQASIGQARGTTVPAAQTVRK